MPQQSSSFVSIHLDALPIPQYMLTHDMNLISLRVFVITQTEGSVFIVHQHLHNCVEVSCCTSTFASYV